MIRALALATALVFALPAWAAPAPKLDVLLAKLQASSKQVRTLSGEFTQRNRIKLFKQELRSRGRLYFQAPRRIRWEYTEPDPSVLVLDGQKATLSTPGAPPQVFDLAHDATMAAIFDQLLLWLGPGSLAQAHNDYQLTASGTAAEPILTLEPKPSSPVAKAFQRIQLRLDGKSWLLKSILLVEKSGDEKEITFTRLERNVPLPPNAFHVP
ncbi:MAG TPA: outer membrane lipoprotein carrier protein LolA [Polyangia bacterium]